MPKREPVFRGPARLREIWLALAERYGTSGADRILGERLDMKPQSIAYRRRTDMWYGIRWEGAVAGLAADGRR